MLEAVGRQREQVEIMDDGVALRRDDDAGSLQCGMIEPFSFRIVEAVGDLAQNWKQGGDGQDAVFTLAVRPTFEFFSLRGLRDGEKRVRLFILGGKQNMRNVLMDQDFGKL